jgi:hypothetical chaperone protein
MHIGVDFGTTNSGAAYFDGRQVRMLPIDPSGPDPTVMRTMLYITRDHKHYFGQAALDTYYEQNVGRPSKMARQWVGEIEMTFAELGTFVRDVYVMIDELVPGRLMRSLKSGLATTYEGTTIFDRYYQLEELIALYLKNIRDHVQQETGETVDGIVLGRPVNFVGSQRQADNRRAESRLRRAAEIAGFTRISFELEPVAAALHYELTIDTPQNVIVFDFGGGTLDITVMRIGDAQRHIFAVGGVGIAGDIFDQRIVQGLLLEHFGRGSVWGKDRDRFPDMYTDALTNWQTAMQLNRPETLHFLRWAQLTGDQPARVRALESLLVNNYAVQMFDQVEQTKIALSDKRFALIRLESEDIHIWQPVTRSQLEYLIDAEREQIERCLLDTLSRAGLKATEIDAVVRTGGSAQIPCFVQMLNGIFVPERVVLSSVFSGVTAGLAIQAAARNNTPSPPSA